MTRDALLPANSTALEVAVSETLDFLPALRPYAAAVHGFKFARPLNASIAPWLVVEYGLGAISPFFDTIEDLIDAGIDWQRVRGTPAAIETALGWIDYDSAQVLDQWLRRRKWNRYQLAMAELPGDNEVVRLQSAEYLIKLSDAARSVPFRGFYGYDVRALEWSGSYVWSGAIWGDDSGVRLTDGTVKWSHGQSHTGAISAGETERQALGIDVAGTDEPGWDDFPWSAPGVTWEDIEDVPAFKSFLLRRLPILVGFYDEGGYAIGYRRPTSVADVTDVALPGGDLIAIEVKCRTGFGDGAGRDVATCALVFRAGNPAKPGQLWIEPEDIEFEDGFDAADMKIGSVALAVKFGRTTRQHVTLTLEI